MADFLYEAKDKSGRNISGQMKGASAQEVEARLQKDGLGSIKVRKKPIEINLPIGQSVNAKDLKTFTQQFSTMIDAGLPLVQCLDILGSQCDNKYFGKCLLEIKSTVEGGSTFSDALAKFPKIFDTLFVNLIAAGELGGILDTIMKRLSEYIEKKEKLQRRVKGAMVYPSVVLVITFVIVFILLKWVVPTFEKMFGDFGNAALPAPTQVVIGISNSFQNWWYVILGVIIGFIFAYKTFVRTTFGRHFMDGCSCIFPLWVRWCRKSRWPGLPAHWARCCRRAYRLSTP